MRNFMEVNNMDLKKVFVKNMKKTFCLISICAMSLNSISSVCAMEESISSVCVMEDSVSTDYLTYGSLLSILDTRLLDNENNLQSEVLEDLEEEKLKVLDEICAMWGYSETVNEKYSDIYNLIADFDGKYSSYRTIIEKINEIWTSLNKSYRYMGKYSEKDFGYVSRAVKYDWIDTYMTDSELSELVTYEGIVRVMSAATDMEVEEVFYGKNMFTAEDVTKVLDSMDHSKYVNFELDLPDLDNLVCDREGIYAMFLHLYASDEDTFVHTFEGSAADETGESIYTWRELADVELYDLRMRDDLNDTLKVRADGGYNYVTVTVHEREGNSEKRFAVIEQVEGILLELFESGYLYHGMSDTDKAELLYTWCCNNLEYVEDLVDYYNGADATNMIENKEGVCAGYTSLYNLMCNSLGINAVAVRSGSHVWTSLYLDGEWTHTDVTWGDSKTKINYSYFNTTLEYMQSKDDKMEHVPRYGYLPEDYYRFEGV